MSAICISTKGCVFATVKYTVGGVLCVGEGPGNGSALMSLSAIQDNLVKSNLVQQTQARGDDVARGQEIAQAAAQREHDRQEDQVVIQTRQRDQDGIRSDEEREKEGGKKKRQDEDEDGAEESRDEKRLDDEKGEEGGTRAVMRRINIVI